MKEKIDNQKLISRILGTKCISFNPDLAKITGDITTGLFLSQLLYWSDRGRNPEWIFKTVKDLCSETLLSKTQQLNAQKKCIALGILEVSYRQVPRKRHFRINLTRIIDLLEELRRNETIRSP